MDLKENIAIAKKRRDGILELVFLQENKTLNLEEVQFGWKLAESLDMQKEACVLLRTGKWTLLDSEAAKFAFTEMKKWTAVAILVHNPAQKLFGSVGLSIVGQSHKLKLYTNETEAENWLKQKMKGI